MSSRLALLAIVRAQVFFATVTATSLLHELSSASNGSPLRSLDVERDLGCDASRICRVDLRNDPHFKRLFCEPLSVLTTPRRHYARVPATDDKVVSHSERISSTRIFTT
jgi:hypothetical protein